MRKHIKIARPVAAAFGLVALVSVIPANAADVIMEETPAPTAFEDVPSADWSGAYAGATVGYGFAGRTEEPGNKIDTDGFMGGGFVGYNHQIDNIVVGGEADLGYSGVDGRDAGTRSRSGLEGSVRARVGIVAVPDVLVYGTAGGAAQHLDIREGGESDDRGMLGYTVGAGSDVKLTEQVFGRAEYRYTDFGSKTFSTGSGSRKVDASDHRVNLGVGVNF